MNIYFYIMHPFLKQQGALQMPLYIEAASLNDAKSKADVIKTAIKAQFDLLFEPSEPVLVVSSLNEQRFDSLMNQMNKQNTVNINLPQAFNINVYQKNKGGNPLSTVEARILVAGPSINVGTYFSL